MKLIAEEENKHMTIHLSLKMFKQQLKTFRNSRTVLFFRYKKTMIKVNTRTFDKDTLIIYDATPKQLKKLRKALPSGFKGFDIEKKRIRKMNYTQPVSVVKPSYRNKNKAWDIMVNSQNKEFAKMINLMKQKKEDERNNNN